MKVTLKTSRITSPGAMSEVKLISILRSDLKTSSQRNKKRRKKCCRTKEHLMEKGEWEKEREREAQRAQKR